MDTINAFVSTAIAIAYLIGIFSFIYGLVGFKNHSRNPQQWPLSTCIMNVLVGAMMLSLPSIYSVIVNSTIKDRWNDRSPLEIEANVGDLDDLEDSFFGRYLPGETAQIVIALMYFVGLVAFIRGLMMLRYVGLNSMNMPAGANGGLTRGVTHMLGGVVVMNLTTISCIMANTLGIDSLCVG